VRISTGQIFQGALSALLEQQARLMHTQQQLATGKRILSPSDDPAAAAQLVGLRQSLQVTGQYQDNITAARSRLQHTEDVLASVTNVLGSVRTLALQANNATMSEADRRLVAIEIRQRLDELMSLANTRDAGGEYLFAGYQGLTRPFSFDASGNTLYHGDDGQRFAQTGPVQQVAVGVPGSALFMAIPRGNGVFVVREDPANAGSGVIDPGAVVDPAAWDGDTYTIRFIDPENYVVEDGAGDPVAGGGYESGAQIAFRGIATRIEGAPQAGDSFTVAPAGRQDMFTTIDSLAQSLESGAGSASAVANAVNRFLVDIDQALENVQTTRARTGARLKALDSQEETNADSILRLQQARSSVEDLDYASAISHFSRQQVGLEAAQRSFLQIQTLSLFSYL
jgi:flagellar hook-associated protein 3 FlgL